jgi:3-deoxy-D-manno-octulosonic-acid transferase
MFQSFIPRVRTLGRHYLPQLQRGNSNVQTTGGGTRIFRIVGAGGELHMRAIYDFVFLLGMLIAGPFYFLRLWRRGNWREGFLERFGHYSSRTKQALTNRRVIWLHAVSVGEANLAALLLPALEARLPHLKFVISTTTTTGMGELRRRLPAAVEKIYFPIDRRAWVRRAFSVLHPQALILVEAELWPNCLWHARRRRIPVVLVNARISPRSFRRYQRAGFLFRDLFAGLAAVSTQSDADAGRLEALGCPTEAVHVVGSLKFDLPPMADRRLDVDRLLRHAGKPEGARVLLGGSTHEGEEALLADIFQRLRRRHPDLYLVLVPRHFERSRSIGAQLERRGLRYVYRSEVSFAAPPAPGATDCLVVNSTGELRQFYPFATLVFVGKSLIGQGGQNPIEPAAAGRPIVFGPNMQNFPEIAPRFVNANAAVQVDDGVGLERALDELLRDDARRELLGRNARAVVESSKGALDRTVGMILGVLEQRGISAEQG